MQTAADQLAQWIEAQHPGLYAALHAQVANQLMRVRAAKARLNGFGDDAPGVTTTFDDSSDDTTSFDVSSSYTPATVDIATLSSSDLTDVPAFSLDSSPAVSSSLATTTDNSGSSFLDSLSSGIQSAASGVASFLASPGGLTAVAGLATAYFKLQTTKTNAAVQTQVLQAQLQRAGSGASPYPITYVTGANGQVIPVYATGGAPISSLPIALQNAIATGQAQYVDAGGVEGYTVPTNILGGLSGFNLSNALPWLALIVGGFLLIKALD